LQVVAVAAVHLALTVEPVIVDIAQEVLVVMVRNGHLTALIMPVVAEAQPIVALFLLALLLVEQVVAVKVVTTVVQEDQEHHNPELEV
jgi:hypothetical protein